jgi:pimeloyl-ACP methyl ester carboxylesterase
MIRAGDRWIPKSGSGTSRTEGTTDTASSYLTSAGKLRIIREINSDTGSEDGSTSRRWDRYRSTVDFDLNLGKGEYSFQQTGGFQDEAGRITYSGNVRMDLAVVLVEGAPSCVQSNFRSVLVSDERTTLEQLIAAQDAALGMVADGASQVAYLFRTNVPEAEVEFALQTEDLPGRFASDAQFRLAAVGGSSTTGNGDLRIRAPIRKIGEEYYAAAILTAPLPYTRLSKQIVSDTVRVQALQAGQKMSESSLQIYLPPVVTVHGIWSSSGTWLALQNYLSMSGYPSPRTSGVNNVNYSDINTLAFFDDRTQTRLQRSVLDTLGEVRARGIAARKVDLVGHSMGGLISRYFVERSGGDTQVRKIVTVATPHFGSPLANYMETYAGNRLKPICGSMAAWVVGGYNSVPNLEEFLRWRETEIRGGGNTSLRTDVTPNYLRGGFPYSAIIGVAPADTYIEAGFDRVLSPCFGDGRKLDQVLDLWHDTTVPYNSQRGYASEYQEFTGVIHSAQPGFENFFDTTEEWRGIPVNSDPAYLEAQYPPIWREIRRMLSEGPGAARTPFDQKPGAKVAAAAVNQAPERRPASLSPEQLDFMTTDLSAMKQVQLRFTVTPSSLNLELGKEKVITLGQFAKAVKGVMVQTGPSLDNQQIKLVEPFAFPIYATKLGAWPVTYLVIYKDNTYSLGKLTYQVTTPDVITEIKTSAERIILDKSGESTLLRSYGVMARGITDTTDLQRITAVNSAAFLGLKNNRVITATTDKGVGALFIQAAGQGRILPVSIGGCAGTLTAQRFVAATARSVQVKIDVPQDCAWGLFSADSWVGAGYGQGPATLAVPVDANRTRSSRTARLFLGEFALDLFQPPAGCSYALKVPPTPIPKTGAEFEVSITAPESCPAMVVSGAHWLVPNWVGLGFGATGVKIRVLPSDGTAREGYVYIADQWVRVPQ